MKRLSTFLGAAVVAAGLNAQTTLPRAVYSLDFEGVTSVSDFGGIQHGEGALVQSDDPNFGTYYQNMPNATTASTRQNFLEVPTTAWTDIYSKDNKALTIGFWVNATVANAKNIANYWGPLFNGYNANGCAGATWLCAYEVRYGGQIHGNSGAWYDNNHDDVMADVMTWSLQDSINPGFDDNWHYFTTVYSNIDQSFMNYKLYIDGVLKIDQNEEIHTNPDDMWKGTSYLDRFCIGGNSFNWADPDNAYAYDDIAFYADALSEDQISLIMNIKRNELTEEDRLALAQAQLEDAIIEAGATQDEISGYGFEALANALGDYLMEIDVYSFETIAAINAQMTEIKEKQDAARAVIAAWESATSAITFYNDYIDNTMYDGAEDFSAAITAATEAIADPISADAISAVMQQLNAAKTAYVFSQEGDVIDVTRLVSAPWFVSEPFEPTKADDGNYVFADEAAANLSSAGWTLSSSDALRGATDCTLYFTNGRTTANLFHSSTVAGGVLDVRQTIAGLPAGYYEVSADMASSSVPTDNHVYAISQGITKVSPAPSTAEYSAWNGYWETLTADKVLVGDDGTLTIGATATTDGTQYKGWFCVTNFQLKYYGPTYDMAEDVTRKGDEAREAIGQLSLSGDRAAASAELDAILAGEASDYNKVSSLTNLLQQVAAIYATETAFTADARIQSLREAEADETVRGAYSLGETTIKAVLKSDTVSVAALPVLSSLCEAYVQLAAAVRAATQWGTSDATQAAQSAAGELAAAEAQQDRAAVEAKAEGLIDIMKATITDFEASAENPKDITIFVGNPSFEGDLHSAWNIVGTYAVQQAEIEFYNNSFRLSQTLSGLPVGKYKIVASGFYRDGDDYATVVSNYQTVLSGDTTVYATHANMKLFAEAGFQKITTPFVSIASDSLAVGSEDDDTYLDYYGNTNHVSNFYTTLDNTADPTVYYPYWMWDAFDMISNRGRYAGNELVFNVAYKSPVTIGVEKETTIAGDWSIADNFRLYYLGQPDTVNATVEDITRLIGKYLEEGTTITISDITDLIDFYLAQ